jgi:hypothetical protein
MEDRVKVRYIYCYWLVLWVILYLLGIFTISPWFSIACGILFTIIFLNSIKNINHNYIIVCLIWHFVLLMLVKCDLSIYTIAVNIIIFCLYLIFLWSSNTSFSQIYFIEITKYYENRPFSISNYIKSIIYNV